MDSNVGADSNVGVGVEVKDIRLRANCSPLSTQPSSAKRNFDAFRFNLAFPLRVLSMHILYSGERRVASCLRSLDRQECW